MAYSPPQMTNPAWKQEMLDGKMKVELPSLPLAQRQHLALVRTLVFWHVVIAAVGAGADVLEVGDLWWW